jgi:uncharacterized protein
MSLLNEVRKALSVHKTPTSDGAWDGPASEANLKLDQDQTYYRDAFAWQDPEGDPKTKADYRFIHHEVIADGTVGAANLKACSTGIGVLNGGMGGTTIPAADKRGVYEHLAAHLKDAGQDVPELKSAAEGVEYRTMSRELRIAGEGGKQIVGHAAVFDQLSLPMYGFREQVKKGAFKKTIMESDIRALWNHNPDHVLGRNKAGTLKLEEDETGLLVTIDPPDTQWANDLRESIRRGDVTQMSFGFRTIRDSFHTGEGELVRDLEEVQLFDVSPVTYPAYPTTDVSVRALAFASSQVAESKDTKLFKAMMRMKNGEEMRAEDSALLTDFAGNLQKKLNPSVPAPVHTDTVKPAETRHLDVERMKLELIMLQEKNK